MHASSFPQVSGGLIIVAQRQGVCTMDYGIKCFIWGISVKVHLIWRKNSHCILPFFKRIPGDLPTLSSESSDGSLSSSLSALET